MEYLKGVNLILKKKSLLLHSKAY